MAQGCHSCLASAVSPDWHRRACVPGLAAGNSHQDVKQMMQACRNRKAVISLLQTRRGAGAGAGAACSRCVCGGNCTTGATNLAFVKAAEFRNYHAVAHTVDMIIRCNSVESTQLRRCYHDATHSTAMGTAGMAPPALCLTHGTACCHNRRDGLRQHLSHVNQCDSWCCRTPLYSELSCN